MPNKSQTAKGRAFAEKARAIAANGRAIQRQVDRKDRRSTKDKEPGAMQV